MIETGQLTKAYGDVLVVDGVSLRIPAGGVTAIIGPNGAGKSTFLSMVARLTPMSSGVVTVGGLDVSGTPGDVLAKRLSILRQDNQIAMRLTAADAAKVDEAIGFLNLGDLAERFLDELSGGQRQRAFVAMVLAQDTDYVLLDEPLNNLDMKHAVAMMQLVRNAADKLGKTVVVVLHDINFASCYADHIVAMRDGRLAMQGPPSQLITTEALAGIYDMEIPVEIIGGRRICVYFG